MKRDLLFPIAVGLTDGIITALIFTAGKILHVGGNISPSLAIRIAIGVALPSVFTFYVAEYARLRRELVDASRELNLSSPMHLINSQLGRVIIRKALIVTSIGTVAGFAGALLPLLVSVVIPNPTWLPIAAAILALGAFGVGLAISVRGNPIYWMAALVAAGVLVTIIGSALHIVG